MQTIKLSEEERRQLEKLQRLQYLKMDNNVIEVNTWPDYIAALSKWTDAVCAKYQLDRSKPFFSN